MALVAKIVNGVIEKFAVIDPLNIPDHLSDWVSVADDAEPGMVDDGAGNFAHPARTQAEITSDATRLTDSDMGTPLMQALLETVLSDPVTSAKFRKKLIAKHRAAITG